MYSSNNAPSASVSSSYENVKCRAPAPRRRVERLVLCLRRSVSFRVGGERTQKETESVPPIRFGLDSAFVAADRNTNRHRPSLASFVARQRGVVRTHTDGAR